MHMPRLLYDVKDNLGVRNRGKRGSPVVLAYSKAGHLKLDLKEKPYVVGIHWPMAPGHTPQDLTGEQTRCPG